MSDEAENRYRESEERRRELETKHRELEREVQAAANEERQDLRKRVEKIERNYMERTDLEATFKEIFGRLTKLDVKVYGAFIAFSLIVGGIELFKHIK